MGKKHKKKIVVVNTLTNHVLYVAASKQDAKRYIKDLGDNALAIMLLDDRNGDLQWSK